MGVLKEFNHTQNNSSLKTFFDKHDRVIPTLNINRYTDLVRIPTQDIHHLVSVFKLVRQPVETLIKTISGSGTCGLDIPISVAQSVKSELVGNLGRIHRVWKILKTKGRLTLQYLRICLFVGEDEQNSIAQFIL